MSAGSRASHNEKAAAESGVRALPKMSIKQRLHLVIAAGNEALFRVVFFLLFVCFLICFRERLMAVENQSRDVAYVSCLLLPSVCSA